MNSSRILPALVALAATVSPLSLVAQVTTNASDNSANYDGAGEPGWTNGANAGFGFSSWSLTNNPGTAPGGSATTGISSNPGAVVQGMGSDAFRMWAYTTNAASVAQRSFLSPLAAGQTFSLQWGINFDSGNIGGNKGFVLLSGTNQLVNVNNGNSSAITFNTSNVGFGYGNNAMTWSFTMDDATTLSVLANDRDGTGTFTTNLTIGSQIDTFRFYITSQQDNNISRYQYFDDLQITTVPEPSTWALMAAGLAAVAFHRLRRKRQS